MAGLGSSPRPCHHSRVSGLPCLALPPALTCSFAVGARMSARWRRRCEVQTWTVSGPVAGLVQGPPGARRSPSGGWGRPQGRRGRAAPSSPVLVLGPLGVSASLGRAVTDEAPWGGKGPRVRRGPSGGRASQWSLTGAPGEPGGCLVTETPAMMGRHGAVQPLARRSWPQRGGLSSPLVSLAQNSPGTADSQGPRVPLTALAG